MNTRTANYCLKQGFVNIKRNKLFSLASIGTIAACTFLIGVIFTIIINVNFMEKKVEQQVGVTIFFNEGLSQQLSLIHISEPTRLQDLSRMPSSA